MITPEYTPADGLIERLRQMASAIYVAVDVTVADDIADALNQAADRLASQSPIASSDLVEALTTAIAALGHINATTTDDGPLRRLHGIAVSALSQICFKLGNERYDELAEQALASRPASPQAREAALEEAATCFDLAMNGHGIRKAIRSLKSDHLPKPTEGERE